MFTVIVRRYSHFVMEPHDRERFVSAWTRAHGKSLDTTDRDAAQATADRINALAPDRDGEGCRHWQALVVKTDDVFKPPRPEVRERLEDAGIVVHDPGPAGRIVK